MNKRTIGLILSSLIIVSFFTGCSNKLNEENARLNEEIRLVNEQKAQLEKQVNELTVQTQALNEKLKTAEEKSGSVVDKNKTSDTTFNIYTADIDDYSKKIALGIDIQNDLDLKGKLNTIAEALSKSCFQGLPIDVLEVKNIDGKGVAVINLKESKENEGITNRSKLKGNTWANNQFQGSAGGNITSVALIETFLQKEYDGKWIDGVQFLYNNGTIKDFEHVPDLGKINYRK